MNTRLEIFKNGMKQCSELLVKYPNSIALTSISKQIEYLIAIESDASIDRSRLKEIIIGALTAREVEALDEGVAKIFYKIASEARSM
jgi:Tsi6